MESKRIKLSYATPKAAVYQCAADVITSSVGAKYLSDWSIMDEDVEATLNQTVGE